GCSGIPSTHASSRCRQEIARPEQLRAPSRRRSGARLGQTRTYHKSTYSGANPIWNVVGGLDLGVEALYGWVKKRTGPPPMLPVFSIHGKVYVCEARSVGISPQPASLAGGGKGTYHFNLKDSFRHSPRDSLTVSWNGLAPKADLVTDARRHLIRVAAKCVNLAFRVG